MSLRVRKRTRTQVFDVGKGQGASLALSAGEQRSGEQFGLEKLVPQIRPREVGLFFCVTELPLLSSSLLPLLPLWLSFLWLLECPGPRHGGGSALSVDAAVPPPAGKVCAGAASLCSFPGLGPSPHLSPLTSPAPPFPSSWHHLAFLTHF